MRGVTMTFGTRLGPYEIRSPRDVPGLGEVYHARDHDLGRNIAIRVLRVDFAADPDRQRRFEEEAHAAAQLADPNILTVHDVGTVAQAAYIVSEPLDGETLREVLNRGALPVATAARHAAQIAHGLAAAHGKGIVHRDLEPENILVAPEGGVKIMRFGLAAVTQSESSLARGAPLGTLSYMSPEQLRGARVDQRSDMFAFGAIVHEMLTGARAFSGRTPIDTITAVLESDPLPPSASDIPPVLTRIVDLSLKKLPESRLSAEDVVIALQGFWSQPGPTGDVPVPGTPINVRRFARVAAVLGAIALAALAGPWLLSVARSAWTSTAVTPASTPPTSPLSTPTPPASTPLASTPATSPPTPPTPPTSRLPATTPAPSPPPALPSAPSVSTPSTSPRVAAGPQRSQLVWFDREGTELGRIGAPADYGDVSLSPDGMRVAVSVREPGSEAADIWVFDVASGMGTRVTSDPADDIAPVWSPDGRRILFASLRRGSYDIYQRASSETGTDTVVVQAEGDQIAYDWSSDGRYLLYQTDQPGIIAGGNLDLGAQRLPSGRPFAFLRTIFAASRATFSPDGSRAVYTSLEGGREDVYVAQFPNYNGRRRISERGGSWSRWSRDGSKIFYLDLDNRMTAAPVEAGSSDLSAGAPRALFQVRARPDRGYAYDVSADGQRFLVNVVGNAVASGLKPIVLAGWRPSLSR